MSIQKDSGVILLTEDDLREYREGQVSDRVKQVWEISSLEELEDIIDKNNYKVI